LRHEKTYDTKKLHKITSYGNNYYEVIFVVNDKKMKRVFIKEALGTRNYFSYRTDLVLYKAMLSILVLLAVFLITDNLKFSVLMAAEVFLIFTLINKLNIERKKNEGKEKLISKNKKEHFKKKIDEINSDDFEMLIAFLFEKKGCRNFVKKGMHMWLAEKGGIINCIKVYKLYDDMELEKLDVRNLVTFMCQNNIKIGYLITTGSLSDGAKELIEKYSDKLNIEVVEPDGLLNIMDEQGLLPDDEYFSHSAAGEKISEKKKVNINNVIDNKKIFIYIPAAAFFYAVSAVMPENSISRYISYYFIILSIICIFYLIWVKYISAEAKN